MVSERERALLASDHDLFFPRLVIGSNLPALLYSYFNNLPLLKNGNDIFVTDFINIKTDMSLLGFPPWKNRFYNEKFKIVKLGWQKIHVYNRMSFVLSLAGLNFLSNKFTSARIDDDKKIIVIQIEGERVVRVGFDKLIVFSDYNIDGLPKMIKKNNIKMELLDWINVKCMEPHKVGLIKTQYDLCGQIFFHKSGRKHTKNKFVITDKRIRNIEKDLIAHSVVADDLMGDATEVDVLLATVRILQRKGLRGSKKGFNYNKFGERGPQRYNKMILEHNYRQVRELSDRVYESVDWAEFRFDDKEEDILKTARDPNSYAYKMLKNIFLEAKEEKWKTVRLFR